MFSTTQNGVFGGFENDNILSSKSYTVTKSGIYPQRKLGSLQDLKLKLIRKELIFFYNDIKKPFIWWTNKKRFENDNILSSKSYTVTKNEISPQRKLGSLRN